MVLDKSKDGTPLFLLIKHIIHHVGLIIVGGTLVISEKDMTHYHSYRGTVTFFSFVVIFIIYDADYVAHTWLLGRSLNLNQIWQGW